MLCDAYGLADRGDLVETIRWWRDRCWRGIQASAAAGTPPGLALRDAGVITDVRDAWQWVRSHRDRLDAEVQQTGRTGQPARSAMPG